jgi:hypothetical protein
MQVAVEQIVEADALPGFPACPMVSADVEAAWAKVAPRFVSVG